MRIYKTAGTHSGGSIPVLDSQGLIIGDNVAIGAGRDKYYVGYFEEDRLGAVIDLILRYPNEETAFIGLFMMEKSSHYVTVVMERSCGQGSR